MRLHKTLFLKISAVIIIAALIFFAAGRKRKAIIPYFDTRCLEYRQKDYSRKLNDMLVTYSAQAKRKGIIVCRNDDDLKDRISSGKLVKVTSGRYYVVEKMTYSSPYLTKEGKMLLDEIAKRFRRKVSEKGLKGARIVITSMTRQSENLKTLRMRNVNSSENSPHLYGVAFDISYKRIIARKFKLTNCDSKYMKDALGEVIWEMRQEKKCWATYERMQNCFHVVAR
jgi:hypothetical protein